MTYLFLPNSYGLLKQFLIVKEEFANNLQLVSLSRIKKMFNKKFELKLALTFYAVKLMMHMWRQEGVHWSYHNASGHICNLRHENAPKYCT